jgi:hypothetical protein
VLFFPCSWVPGTRHLLRVWLADALKPRPWPVVPEGLMQGLGEPWRAKPVVSYTFAGDPRTTRKRISISQERTERFAKRSPGPLCKTVVSTPSPKPYDSWERTGYFRSALIFCIRSRACSRLTSSRQRSQYFVIKPRSPRVMVSRSPQRAHFIRRSLTAIGSISVTRLLAK